MADVYFTPTSARDYLELDHSVQLQVRSALARVQADPYQYGDPLGKKVGIDLFGLYSIRAGQRIRVIYAVRDDGVVIVTVGKREKFLVHQTAQARIEALRKLTAQELKTLGEVIGESASNGGG